MVTFHYLHLFLLRWRHSREELRTLANQLSKSSEIMKSHCIVDHHFLYFPSPVRYPLPCLAEDVALHRPLWCAITPSIWRRTKTLWRDGESDEKHWTGIKSCFPHHRFGKWCLRHWRARRRIPICGLKLEMNSGASPFWQPRVNKSQFPSTAPCRWPQKSLFLALFLSLPASLALTPSVSSFLQSKRRTANIVRRWRQPRLND